MIQYEVWLCYPGSGDPPGEGADPFETVVGVYNTREEAQGVIDSRYEDGRFHAETYEIKEIACV